jgi:5-methylthioadenosine/S-adenosylhomocysteine deaminase
MATWNGAVALGMHDKIGSIEKGKLADFVAIDLSNPQCQPIYDPVSSLIYSSHPHVSHVWIGGKCLVKNGQVISKKLQLDINQVKDIGRKIAEFKSSQEAQRAQRLLVDNNI